MAGDAAVDPKGGVVNPYCHTHCAFHRPHECARYELRQRISLLVRAVALPALSVSAVVWIWR